MKINRIFCMLVLIAALLIAEPSILFAQTLFNNLYGLNNTAFCPLWEYRIFKPDFYSLENDSLVEDVYRTSYLHNLSAMSYINGSNALINVLFSENKDNEESIARRYEILFFISIPFIYLYINLLINLQNSMLGNSGTTYSEGQNFFMLSTILLFGLEVIITDSTKD